MVPCPMRWARSTLSQGYYDKETGAKVADGKLFLPINANPVETTGSIGTVTIKVTTDNYEDFFLTIDVSATNKIVPIGEPTLSTTTITYGDKLSKVTLSGRAEGRRQRCSRRV